MRLIHPALKISSAIAQMVGEQPQIEALLSGDMYIVVIVTAINHHTSICFRSLNEDSNIHATTAFPKIKTDRLPYQTRNVISIMFESVMQRTNAPKHLLYDHCRSPSRRFIHCTEGQAINIVFSYVTKE